MFFIPFLPATAIREPSLDEENALIGPSTVWNVVLDGNPVTPYKINIEIKITFVVLLWDMTLTLIHFISPTLIFIVLFLYRGRKPN